MPWIEMPQVFQPNTATRGRAPGMDAAGLAALLAATRCGGLSVPSVTMTSVPDAVRNPETQSAETERIEPSDPDSRLRLLCVHAHPDDESSKGAATMAKYVDEGAEVLVVSCTGGERGDILNPALKDRPEILANMAEIR